MGKSTLYFAGQLSGLSDQIKESIASYAKEIPAGMYFKLRQEIKMPFEDGSIIGIDNEGQVVPDGVDFDTLKTFGTFQIVELYSILQQLEERNYDLAPLK